MTHPPAGAFEEYVIGSLAGPTAMAFESHVAECEDCAATLQREARLEMKLGEVGRRLGSDEPRVSGRSFPRPGLTGWASIGALTAIAAAVLVLTPRSSRRTVEPTRTAVPADAVPPMAIEQRVARNDTVALDELDESMAGSALDGETGDANFAAVGAMQ